MATLATPAVRVVLAPRAFQIDHDRYSHLDDSFERFATACLPPSASAASASSAREGGANPGRKRGERGAAQLFFLSFLRVGPLVEIRARGVINSWVHSTLKFLRASFERTRKSLARGLPRAAPAAVRLLPAARGGWLKPSTRTISRRGSCHFRRTRKYLCYCPGN